MTKQEMLKDPEYQNNIMLANRSISGKYKFQDGTIRTYVGSYEHKFLEFMDKFLNKILSFEWLFESISLYILNNVP